MSDLSIPGVGTSKYGSDKIVEALMKAERVPRERAATELKGYEDQKSVWLDMSRRLTSFRDDARNLYSFKNPFSSRIAKSSDEDVLTATATREALEATSSILVKRAAATDRFISTNLAKDYKVPAGSYKFTVGDKSIELNYGGGGLQDFADSLSRKGRDLLKASVVSVTTDTKALIIESKKTGAKNRLGFSGDAEKLALAAGIMKNEGTQLGLPLRTEKGKLMNFLRSPRLSTRRISTDMIGYCTYKQKRCKARFFLKEIPSKALPHHQPSSSTSASAASCATPRMCYAPSLPKSRDGTEGFPRTTS